jgi:MoaA/NifB/PqqE/SkfB family radical SAM enzyme
MISFLRYHNISACVSSNFSLRLSDEKLTALLLSGLEHLIVAIDGVTPESYKMYRKGGDLELVLSNVRRLVALRERLGITSLVLDLQFIEFEHNMHERSQALLLARELGADRHTVIRGSSLEGWLGNRFRGTEEERREAGCYQAWVSTHIDSEGAVKLCDYGNDHGMPALGQAHECVSSAVRNNDFAVTVRGTFSNKNSHLKEWCRTCSLYRVAPRNGASLQDQMQSANRLHQLDLRVGEPACSVHPGNRRK